MAQFIFFQRYDHIKCIYYFQTYFQNSKTTAITTATAAVTVYYVKTA